MSNFWTVWFYKTGSERTDFRFTAHPDQLATLHQPQTFTNIFAPSPNCAGFSGLQYELIDLRSRENSSVQSLRHIDWICRLHAVPMSFRFNPDLLVPKTFIFSTRTVSAVSVASPTFSYIFFVWNCDKRTNVNAVAAFYYYTASPQKVVHQTHRDNFVSF